jgi:hypothetical protein
MPTVPRELVLELFFVGHAYITNVFIRTTLVDMQEKGIGA